ncbi:MAG: exopolysaccharide biosynthesis protein [Bryobacterales bacterium]|nr:exopolysaccharide biosynthesis protein [Bryobacterales bacterium]
MDDGAKTLEDSVAMLAMAHEHGTTDIVASPHASPEFKYDPELIAARIAELQAVAPQGLRIHRACDFHLSFENIQDALANPRKYTIAGRCYLLVEFPDLAIFPTTGEIFARLMDNGMIPVITHPERNRLLQQKLEDLQKWVEQGALIQVTSNSFTGRWGAHARQFSDTLMKHNLVHCVASDAHDTKHRPPVLTEAREYVVKHWGEARAELLTVTNPKAIIEGRELERETAHTSEKPWWRFW